MKGLLLKYSKKKAPPGSIEKSWEFERMIVKVTGKGALKNPGTSGSAQNLRIMSFIGKDSEGKEKKYDRYVARR